MHVCNCNESAVCTCGAATQERSPPPGVVLHSQLEVGESNGDEGCHNDEDDEDDEEDGVDGVHLVAPHAGKDVVQLNVDGAEGQETYNIQPTSSVRSSRGQSSYVLSSTDWSHSQG